MRRTVITGFLVAALAAPATTALAATPTERSSWVWQGPDEAAVAEAVGSGIDTLYVHTWPDATTDPRWDGFLAAASDAGLAVHALAGDPTWASENRDHLLAWVDRIVADGRFDGIVVDIEPYVLPDWDHKRRGKRLRADLVQTLGMAESRAGATPLRATIPFWYDDPAYDHRKRGSLLEQVAAEVDGLVVMAYRDRLDGPDGAVALSATEVDVAAARGITAVLALEARDTGNDKLDFSAEGRSAMDAALDGLVAAFAGHPGFGGVSAHDHTAYHALPN